MKSLRFTHATATFDPTGRYRYRLHRRWGDGLSCTFIMLNPSTADAEVLDPTVRRCVGFAASWGYEAIEVANLFALRSTDPAALISDPNPVGLENDAAILAAACASELVVAAWGAHRAARTRGPQVLSRLHHAGVVVHALRLTRGGHPCHPLYLPGHLRPLPLPDGGKRP